MIHYQGNLYPSQAVEVCLKSILETYPDLSDKVSLLRNDSQKLKVKGAIMSSGTISLSMAIASIPGLLSINCLSLITGCYEC